MPLKYLLQHDQLITFFESHLPDFVLAFAFFTSLIYAVLGKRFDHQRSAITMSACLGLALSVGLIWWEQVNGYSIRDLGPIAVGFAILLMAFVMYQSVRQVGGSWAGAGITMGLTLLIASSLGFGVPIETDIINTLMGIALIVGLIAFIEHNHRHNPRKPFPATNAQPETASVRRDMTQLYRDSQLSNRVAKQMRRVRNDADLLHEHPEQAGNVMLQIRRMLPAEGYLTGRMAQLRAKAHRIRNGHIARLEETKHVFANLPTEIKKKASAELIASYRQTVGMDKRLERLDQAVAENERRIRLLTQQAALYTANYEHEKLHDALKAAEKLQHHNDKLFKIIERTEKKLAILAEKIAAEVKQNEA